MLNYSRYEEDDYGYLVHEAPRIADKELSAQAVLYSSTKGNLEYTKAVGIKVLMGDQVCFLTFNFFSF